MITIYPTGTGYKKVPTAPLENAQFRRELYLRALESKEHQRDLIELCSNDYLFWARSYLWQFNPHSMEKGPFIPRPYQETVVMGGEVNFGGVIRYQHGIFESIDDAKTVRWPKSRFVGATWVFTSVAVWLALFKQNIKVLCMSKDEKTAEDADDPDSLFWKIQFMLEHLPDWMRRHSGKKKTGVFKFWNGNTITSSANVESAGVGGRATLFIADEFGQFKKGHEIFSMTKDTARCRIFVGTHKGRGTMLYDLCNDPKHNEMREIMTHWSMDEEKARGLYRFNNHSHKVEVLDKSFDYAAICHHNKNPKECTDCSKLGKRSFDFVREEKPAGGPFPSIRSPWYDAETRERSDYDVAMNLDIDPTGSSITFFDPYRISVLKAACIPEFWKGDLIHDKHGNPIRLERSSTGLLKLWVHPKGIAELPQMYCGAAVDVSAGEGSSPSCLSVFNCNSGEKVLQYCNADIYKHDFAVFVCACLRMIKDSRGQNPMVVWELQGGGNFGNVLVNKLHYAPYYQEKTGSGVIKGLRISGGVDVKGPKIIEWMEDYKNALYKGRIENYDEHSLDECLNFVYVGNSVQYKTRSKGKLTEAVESGASIHHGDIVRADALAFKMLKDLGYDEPDFDVPEKSDIPPLNTSGYREWLLEHAREKEEEWV